ncbi:AraC-family transcriptional regulator [Streptomyces sp. SPB78]|nr:AraC-family transcriptional regulator [Streptomyces sp. SPB78]
MYRERGSSVVPGAVLWTRRQSGGADTHVRVLPDACMDLMWVGGRLLVAGPDTTAHVTPVRAGEVYEAVRFPPGAAPSVLGVPAGELRDLRVPLADLWPQRRARELAERVGGVRRPHGRAGGGGRLGPVRTDRARPSAGGGARRGPARPRGR